MSVYKSFQEEPEDAREAGIAAERLARFGLRKRLKQYKLLIADDPIDLKACESSAMPVEEQFRREPKHT
jgi:hypothetical protein